MTFEKEQKVYFIWKDKDKTKKKKDIDWTVREAIVIADKFPKPNVSLRGIDNSFRKTLDRKYIFDTREAAEQKADYWNNWGKYHAPGYNINNRRGKTNKKYKNKNK